MTKVFLLDVRQLVPDTTKYRTILNPIRITKINNYLNETDRQLSLGCELLLIYAIKEIYPDASLPINYEYSPNGAPFLSDYKNKYISISHSQYYACVAISDYPVGVDVQYCRSGNPNMAKRYFDHSEYSRIINASDWRESFYKTWVLKESYLKATGYGFIYGMNSFKINLDDFQATFDELGYWFQILPIGENYQLGICIKEQNDDVSVIKLPIEKF